MSTTLVLTRTNPYPGLVPFEEQDASRFFGRDREIDDILERLASRRLLAVIGVSGCGKSSLVRAGLIPVLRIGAAENLPGRWRIHTMNPGNAPVDALRTVLEAEADWPVTSFDLVQHIRKNLGFGEKLLLIVDQFEELFRFRADTLNKDAGNAAALFVNLVLNAVDQCEIPIYVLLTMRTDFLGECAQFRGLPEALNDCYYLVPRLTRLQQHEAIEQPLKEQNVQMAPGLVQRLLNDSAEDPDQLPVLQHLLKRVWENWDAHSEDGRISMVDYDAVGGWEQAINKDADEVLDRFRAEEREIRQVFQWITDRGVGDKPVRRPRSFAECCQVSGLEPERLSEIIRAFQRRGLLRPSDHTAASLVDLSHESVMWQWSRLDRWITEEAEQAAQLRFLLQSARQQLPLMGLALETASKLRTKWLEQKLPALRYVPQHELEQIDAWILTSENRELARLDDQIDWYSRMSSLNQRRFKLMKSVTLMSLAAIPVLTTTAIAYGRYVASGLAVLAALMEGLQQLNQYNSNWTSYHATSEALKREKFLYLARAGPYSYAENPRAMLVERVESLISEGGSKWLSVQSQKPQNENPGAR